MPLVRLSTLGNVGDLGLQRLIGGPPFGVALPRLGERAPYRGAASGARRGPRRSGGPVHLTETITPSRKVAVAYHV